MLAPDPADPAVRLADAVRAHPAVARLDGGPFGTVAALLPGRRVVGVRVGTGAEPAEVAVVVRPGIPLPRLAAELAAVVRGVLGPVAVDVVFADVETGPGVGGGGGETGEVAGRHAPGPVT